MPKAVVRNGKLHCEWCLEIVDKGNPYDVKSEAHVTDTGNLVCAGTGMHLSGARVIIDDES